MEVSPDQIINGLLEELKRLTIENIALKAFVTQLQEAPMPVMESSEAVK